MGEMYRPTKKVLNGRNDAFYKKMRVKVIDGENVFLNFLLRA